MTSYSKSSPYYDTASTGGFLDIMTHRTITKSATDTLYVIDQVYDLRPDMLAFDLYGKSSLWWVFAARNPNALKDPLFDFRAGTQIYLPSKDTITTDLGV